MLLPRRRALRALLRSFPGGGGGSFILSASASVVRREDSEGHGDAPVNKKNECSLGVARRVFAMFETPRAADVGGRRSSSKTAS